MAEQLDDFFAKKDKKKKTKSKPKFLTAEELVKNLEDTSKLKHEAALKAKKLEAIASAASNSEIGNGDGGGGAEEIIETAPEAPPVPPQEEEWDEFAEEQRKDYTGLKIGQLSLNEDGEQSPMGGDDEDVDSDGNTGGENETRRGGLPWKKVIPAEEVTQIPMEMEKPSKVYISPALRMSQGMAPGARIRTRNRAAPDITNADFFPTLGAARPEEQRKKKNEPAFEEVRHGGRIQRVQEPVSAPASVANRFQSLDEDDS